jgi:putative 4-mercaptohistidine N1-methyltranferase
MTPAVNENPYETPRLVAEYLLFHYGSPEEILPWSFGPREALNFAVRCVAETFTPAETAERALDLGCAVGRSTFELSKRARSVLGIDYSLAFVDAARTIRADEEIRYSRIEEGAVATQLVARVPSDVRRERVRFEQGDAMNLRADLGDFDLVLGANLIDRLSDPRRFLARAPELVRPGGELVLTSPYTWTEEFTPSNAWLAGYDGSSNRRTLTTLIEELSPAFDLVATRDLPFLIREHSRKFQWSVAQATVWRRRA